MTVVSFPLVHAFNTRLFFDKAGTNHAKLVEVAFSSMIHRHLALWVAVLATAFSANTASAHMPSAFRRKQRNDDKPCPPCDLIFRKVKQTPGGERVQNVEMQVGAVHYSHGHFFVLNNA